LAKEVMMLMDSGNLKDSMVTTVEGSRAHSGSFLSSLNRRMAELPVFTADKVELHEAETVFMTMAVTWLDNVDTLVQSEVSIRSP